ncbi:sulfite exporter TauE/SafE family protein [bacterium]|uniref:Probable membrane transporter protein n=2 Tax=Rhodococcus TaxID=1827 RepID=A0A0M8PK87_RHORH|nr:MULTISPECIES: sulfite exporter TauE/SafE family protein [Rhodococcus]MDO2379157.1 sulfite exporter TauE/SafE family protein [Rhodococcus ruber]RIL11022.1 MAG: sulfite exporter TauE/SafE family protein [bacterium]ATQ27844.1 sulfite exporter TauE/SafE family protein [Rhodococcus ruber]AUM15183.1 sulfite exporter TauE/SafE family protein [Rhodococcus ruber]AWG99219.1 sulfite exporter TauE/SafE family protein [Rhodococcus ruber]
MFALLVFTLVGIGAQLVDGALGMAFGVTATTLLIFSGIGPAHASAAVHLAEVGTTLVSGASHWRFRNVDWGVVAKLGVPGALGAFLGATVLSSLSTAAAIPVTSTILLAIGVYVALRFSVRPPAVAHARTSPHSAKFLSPLGLFGGFIDASGGGGWGPITTSTLLSRGKTAPRTVIGSVSASEFLVALAASIGFLVGLGRESLGNLLVVAGLALGGAIAAPIAAWLVSRVPATLLGTAVGGVIVLTNAQKLCTSFEISATATTLLYLLIVAGWIALLTVSWRRSRLTRAESAGALERLEPARPELREPAADRTS